MNIIVSVSQFRQNIATLLTQAQAGYTVIIKDGKKDREIAQLNGKKHFDVRTFHLALLQAAGIFTTYNHPEWKTKRDVVSWVQKSRKLADRTQ